MSSTAIDLKKVNTETKGTDANGTHSPNAQGLTHRFQEGMGSHPLWQEYLAELEANRQADIAEANRLADLELEK